MNGRYLLDTNIVLGLLRGQPEVIELVPVFRKGTLFYSVITRLELLSWHSISQAEEKAIRGILKTLQVVSLEQAIEDLAILFRRTTRLKLPDCIIAASAISVDATLVSYDLALVNASYTGLKTLTP